jgi:hypothetical protein
MMLKANIALMIEHNRLVPAGRGFQPTADFNRGDKIADDWDVEEGDWAGRCWVKINQKTYGICHADYTSSHEEL